MTVSAQPVLAGRRPTARAASGPAPGRPRIAFMAVLLAAAMPLRISDSFPVVSSVSVLDILLILAAATLFLDLAFRPIDVGDTTLFTLLCVPLIASVLSIAWSHDRAATLRSAFIYAEGLVVYLFVIRELAALPPERIIGYLKRFAYLLILPGVLLLAHVPGFQPEEAGLSHSSGSYISYYTRLSHPILGRSNNLATVLAFLAPLLLYWGHARRDGRISRAGTLTVMAIFATLSRGVLVAFVMAGLVYAPLTAGRRRVIRRSVRGKVAAVVALGSAAVAALYALNPDTREFFTGRLSAANVKDRLDLISLALSQVASHPLLGYGAGASPGSGLFGDRDVHNTFLQQVVYLGVPLGAVVSLALLALPAAFLARRATPLAGVIAYTLMVQLVLFLFESSFEGTVLRVLFYMSIGLAFALLRSVEHDPPWRERLRGARQAEPPRTLRPDRTP